MKNLFKFLSSISFAVLLIGCSGLFVAFGTFLESWSDSHLFASQFVYNSFLFGLLLWGFFINILFSALQRWPFKPRHVPFLMTHLGLLMILGGALIKNSYGMQGTMGILEGSGKETIFLANSYSILIEKKDPDNPQKYKSVQFPLGSSKVFPFQEISMEVLQIQPHCSERMETWIKGNQGFIANLRPFPVFNRNQFSEEGPFLPSAQINLFPPPFPSWKLFAMKTEDVEETFLQIYCQHTHIIIKDKKTQQQIINKPLCQILKNSIPTSFGNLVCEINCKLSPLSGLEIFNLNFILGEQNYLISLLDDNKSKRFYLPFDITLEAIPSVIILQKSEGDTFLCAFDQSSRTYAECYCSSLNSLTIFDKGFGGYGAHITLPFTGVSDEELQKEQMKALAAELNEALKQGSEISPPLKFFQDLTTNENKDFPENVMKALAHWDETGLWLFPKDRSLPLEISQLFEKLKWDMLPYSIRKACTWCSVILNELEEQAVKGKDLISLLKQRHWPFAEQLESDNSTIMSAVTQQLFSLVDQLPDLEETVISNPSPSEKFHYWTAWLRAYDIHLSVLPKPNLKKYCELETPITLSHIPLRPLLKKEDNLPLVTLQFTQGEKKEILSLAYDRFGTGLKWPILNGQYLVRFQPKFVPIPYHLRLRDARQINYPHSFQAYSYESDIVISSIFNPVNVIETTLSMNHVYETWDGYRFYLANISPSQETSVQMAQIVVNCDPAKYWLTYPGGIILALGIISLFWFRPYRSNTLLKAH